MTRVIVNIAKGLLVSGSDGSDVSDLSDDYNKRLWSRLLQKKQKFADFADDIVCDRFDTDIGL